MSLKFLASVVAIAIALIVLVVIIPALLLPAFLDYDSTLVNNAGEDVIVTFLAYCGNACTNTTYKPYRPTSITLGHGLSFNWAKEIFLPANSSLPIKTSHDELPRAMVVKYQREICIQELYYEGDKIIIPPVSIANCKD